MHKDAIANLKFSAESLFHRDSNINTENDRVTNHGIHDLEKPLTIFEIN